MANRIIYGLAILGAIAPVGQAWAETSTTPAAVPGAPASGLVQPSHLTHLIGDRQLEPFTTLADDLTRPSFSEPGSTPLPPPSLNSPGALAQSPTVPAPADTSPPVVNDQPTDTVEDSAPLEEPQETVSPEAANSTPVDPWRVEFRPYLQVPFAINGQLNFNSSVDTGGGIGGGGGIGSGGIGSGDDSLSVNLDLGLDLRRIFLLGGELEVWYEDFGLLLDGFYADLGTRVLLGVSSDANTGLVAENTSLELDADYTRLGAALGWRAGRFPLVRYDDVPPVETFPAVTVDVFGGAKYSSYGFEANVPDRGQLFRLNPNWIEPILLGRGELLINPRTKLIANGYVGGFGLGNAPDFSWGGYVGLDWRFFPNVSVRPSYQISSTDWNGTLGTLSLKTQALWLGFSVYFD